MQKKPLSQALIGDSEQRAVRVHHTIVRKIVAPDAKVGLAWPTRRCRPRRVRVNCGMERGSGFHTLHHIRGTLSTSRTSLLGTFLVLKASGLDGTGLAF